MVSDGYTITQHLYANGTGTDGSLYYNGQLSKDGISYDYFIIVCKDSATADSHFSDGISGLQALGFSGSYNSDSTVWSGTTTYHGVAVGAGVTEAANSAPYLVIEFFGQFS